MRPLSTLKWSDTEPSEEREARALAWQEHRSCRDCGYWSLNHEDEDNSARVGACCRPSIISVPAIFIAPEDYTCDEFVSLEIEGFI